MKIDDVADERQLTRIGIGLTDTEARELRDAIDQMLNDPGPRHEHVSSEDYEQELTVWIIRDLPPA